MRTLILAAALALASAEALAQSYPSRPIMFVIPFAAGGDSDLSGRNVAQHASKYLNNTPIVPVNRVGASGAIGATSVKNAIPDGYVLLVARIADLPDVPSAREAGYPDMEKIVGWTALMGPRGLPKPVVDRWTDVFARLAKDADWQAGNARIGGVAAIRSPAETEKYVREQFELYDKLVTSLGIRQ